MQLIYHNDDYHDSSIDNANNDNYPESDIKLS